MTDGQLSPFYLLFGALLGVVAVLSDQVILRALGACALLATAGLFLGGRRLDQDPPDLTPGRTPELSFAERFMPWFFAAAALLTVLALALYTLRRWGVDAVWP